MSGTRFALGVGVLCLALAACSTPPRKPLPPVPTPEATGTRAATPFAGASSIGVLMDADGEHFCTASVVASPKGNVIATAAHCLQDSGGEPEYRAGELEFAPGFSGKGPGTYPYGRWKVSAVHLDDRWTDATEDTDDADAADYAFLTLAPDAKGRQAQSVVGAVTPDWSSVPERRVTVIGYPTPERNPANRPVSCTTDTRPDPELPQTLLMECAGFWDGTSGGPWLADYRDAGRQGRLIGVLSGGDTDRESTAALFDGRARALYERAAG
jgi:V8-like Glu-specific endopeptidase